MKGASFLLKWAAAAVVVALLGAAAATVALKIFFPEPKLRALVVEKARRQFGREIRLDSIGLGPLGLTLRGLEVSEFPDFKAGTFLRVDSFRLRPSWRALARRRLVVAAVSAEGLKIRVVKGADGRYNFETLASSAPARAGAAPGAQGNAAGLPAAPAPRLDVRRVTATGATVEYADRATGAAWTLTDLGLDATNVSLDAPFELEAAFRAVGKAGAVPVDAKVALDAQVNAARGDRAAFKADVRRLVVEAEGLSLAIAGKVAGFDAPRVDFDARLSGGGETLLTAAGRAAWGDAVALDMTAKTPGLDAARLARVAPALGIPAADVPAADVPAADASLSGSFAADRADVGAFRASWAGGEIEASGSARGLASAKPVYAGRARFGVDVPEIEPGRYPFLKLPPKLDAPAARVDGDVSLDGDELKIAALTVKVKEGTASATGAVRKLWSAKPVPDVAVVLALDLPAFKVADLQFPARSLPPSLALPAARLEGTVRFEGDALKLEKVSARAKGATVNADGALSPALALDLTADLDLPALTDKDLPFPGVPAGLRMPPSHWTADLSYSPRLARIKSLRVKTGRNDADVSGTVTDPGGRAAYDLLVKCRSFALEEVTELTPRTRDLKLAGTGFFAFAVTGNKGRPVYAGKLQFKGLGATVAGLPLSDFSGTVSFDQKRVDVPNLTGKLGDGTLKMDLTVKDYARAPEVQLDASIDRFDLGRYLAAKSELSAEREAAKAGELARAGSTPDAAKPGAEPAAKPAEVSTRGHLDVGTLIHPNATATDVKLSWDLRGLTPDLRGLDGDASLHVGGGKILSAGDMAAQSKLLKVLIFPLLIVQKIGRIGGIRLFPDFNKMTLNQIAGDYGFKDGVMTLRRAEMDSDAAQVSATGTIDLPAEALDLLVTAQVARFAPIDVAVTGTFDKPKSKANIGKFLATPASALLKGLLQK